MFDNENFIHLKNIKYRKCGLLLSQSPSNLTNNYEQDANNVQ